MAELTSKDFKNARNKYMNIEFYWPLYTVTINEEKSMVRGEKIKKIYKPLEEYPDLFLKFTQVVEKEEEIQDVGLKELKNWGENYGILAKDTPNPLITEEQTLKDIEGGKFTNLERLSDFNWALTFAFRKLTLYEAVLRHDEKELRERIKPKVKKENNKWDFEIDKKIVTYNLIEKYIPEIPVKSVSKPKLNQVKLEKLALGYIFSEVSNNLNKNGLIPCKPEINYVENTIGKYEIKPKWSFQTLWGAMLMQFYWVLVSISNKIRCKRCGKFFVRKEGSRALYCSECREKGTPRNNDYYQRKKKIKEMAKLGYNVEEIKKEVPRSKIDTIEKTVNEVRDSENDD